MLSVSKIYSPFPEYKGGHHSKTSSPKSSLSSDENMSMVEASSWDGCLGSNVSTPGMPIELCISEVGAWASVDWPYTASKQDLILFTQANDFETTFSWSVIPSSTFLCTLLRFSAVLSRIDAMSTVRRTIFTSHAGSSKDASRMRVRITVRNCLHRKKGKYVYSVGLKLNMMSTARFAALRQLRRASMLLISSRRGQCPRRVKIRSLMQISVCKDIASSISMEYQ